MPLYFKHDRSNRHIAEGRIPLDTMITSAGHSLIELGQYEHHVSNVIFITNMTRHSETLFVESFVYHVTVRMALT